jgi:hypothetical protein
MTKDVMGGEKSKKAKEKSMKRHLHVQEEFSRPRFNQRAAFPGRDGRGSNKESLTGVR